MSCDICSCALMSLYFAIPCWMGLWAGLCPCRILHNSTTFHPPLECGTPLYGTWLLHLMEGPAFLKSVISFAAILMSSISCSCFSTRYLKLDWGTNTLWNPVLTEDHEPYCWGWWGDVFPLASLKVWHKKKFCFLNEPDTKLSDILEQFLSPNHPVDQAFISLRGWRKHCWVCFSIETLFCNTTESSSDFYLLKR